MSEVVEFRPQFSFVGTVFRNSDVHASTNFIFLFKDLRPFTHKISKKQENHQPTDIGNNQPNPHKYIKQHCHQAKVQKTLEEIQIKFSNQIQISFPLSN